jgi:hypothetical protein
MTESQFPIQLMARERPVEKELHISRKLQVFPFDEIGIQNGVSRVTNALCQGQLNSW